MTAPALAQGQLVVDSDVHCAVPSLQALFPYLDAHWRNYMIETSARLPAAVENTYPSWSSMLATPATGIEQLQESLAGVSLAVLHCYAAVEGYTHPYLAEAYGRAVNEWVRDEWLEQDDRLRARATIAPEHTTQAVAEIERVTKDPRFVEIVVPSRANIPYGNELYWPVWEAAAASGRPVGIHSGGVSTNPQTMVGYTFTTYDAYANSGINLQAQIISLVYSGVLQQFPDLRFAIVEGGWTWLPMLMWKVDQEWKAFRREVAWVEEPPSELIRRHFRFTTGPGDLPPTDTELAQIVEQIGSDNVLMYSSDYPHSYDDDGSRLLSVLSPEARERVLSRNASELYGLSLGS